MIYRIYNQIHLSVFGCSRLVFSEWTSQCGFTPINIQNVKVKVQLM